MDKNSGENTVWADRDSDKIGCDFDRLVEEIIESLGRHSPAHIELCEYKRKRPYGFIKIGAFMDDDKSWLFRSTGRVVGINTLEWARKNRPGWVREEEAQYQCGIQEPETIIEHVIDPNFEP